VLEGLENRQLLSLGVVQNALIQAEAAQIPTQTTLTGTSVPTIAGDVVTVTATVTTQAAGTPTGSVVFVVDGAPQTPAVSLVTTGGLQQAVYQTSALPTGPHSFLASYSGDASFAASGTSAPLTEQVVSVSETSAATRASFPVGIAQSSFDHDFYITEAGTGKITQFNPITRASVELSPPTASSGPFGITSDGQGNLFFTELFANKIGEYDPQNGKFTEFPIPTPASAPWGITVGNDGSVYFTESNAGRIGVLNLTTGTITDSLPNQVLPDGSYPLGIAAGPAGDNNVYFADGGTDSLGFASATTDPAGHVTGFSATELPVPYNAGPFSVALGPDGKMWITDTYNSTIDQWDQTNTSSLILSAFDIPGKNADPLDITSGANNSLYFTDLSHNAIGVINATTHVVAETPVVSGFAGVFGIASNASDGSVWFTETIGNQVGSFAGSSTAETPLPSATGGLFGITTGADGALWFSETASSTIDRYDPVTQSLTKLPTPTLNSRPTGITLGHDNNLYFAETAGDIGAINATTGAITEFTPPTPNSGPLGITTGAGSDNRIWFTEAVANQIASFDPGTDTFTEYKIPTQNSLPVGIVATPDGKIWFTEEAASQIGMLDPTTGKILEYPLSSRSGSPAQIIVGPDHNLYFTEVGNQLGEINPTTGVITEFPIGSGFTAFWGITVGTDDNIYLSSMFGSQIVAFNPTTHESSDFTAATPLAAPFGITAGPDGNLWFVEYLAGNLGEVQFQAVPRIETTTSLRSSVSPSFVGDSVTFTAVVTSNPNQGAAPQLPTGTVTFRVDGQNQAPQLVRQSGGEILATYTMATLPAGDHQVVALYNGDFEYGASPESNTVSQVVQTHPTTLSLTAAPDPSTFGQAVVLSVRVLAASPTGTVAFSVDGVPVGVAAVQGVAGSTNGLATFSVPDLTVGTHTVMASYSGDDRFATSAATRVVTVQATPTPTSPVTITGLLVEKVKLGPKHHVKKALVLFVQFSGALATTAAQNLAAYTVFSGKIKKVHKVAQVLYNKPVPLTQAIYNSAQNSVILLPKGKPKLPKYEQLKVNVSLLTDPLSRPINNGKNFTATVTNTGLVIW
jgi:streptogramin lyase